MSKPPFKPFKPAKFPALPGFNAPFQKQLARPNPETLEQLIKGNPTTMKVARPMPCPRVRDVRGDDHLPGCEFCTANGYVYYGETEFVGAFMGNSNQRSYQAQGRIDYDTAQIVVPTKDIHGKDLNVSFLDRIQVEVRPIRFWQRVQTSGSGVDRLQFPAVAVERIVGSDLTEYVPGTDFVIDPYGKIEWRGRRPGYDPINETGEIYSIVYYIKPVYTVLNVPIQTRNSGEGEESRKFPQMITVRREFVAHSTGMGLSDTQGPPGTE